MPSMLNRRAGALERIRSARRVLILRALKLGDLLCAVPAFRAIRAALPKAEIVLLGLPWAREFVERFPFYLDGFREFPGYPGLPEREPRVARIPGFLQEIQSEEFDLAIQLHGSGSYVNSLVELFAAKQSAGFFVPGEYCPSEAAFAPWPESGLEIHRLLSLTTFLEMPAQGDFLEFPITAHDEWELGQAIGPLDAPFAIVHAGASVAERRWPAERFAEVADRLAAHGFQIVLTGVEAEWPIAERIASLMAEQAINLAGRTSLGALAALVRRSQIVVCNDTGISHIAAALRVPSVILSTGDNPARWAPIDRHRHRVLAPAEQVHPDGVFDEIRQLINGRPARLASAPRHRESRPTHLVLEGRSPA